MMKIGLCTVTLASKDDPAGIQHLQMAKVVGYDYAELPIAQIMDLSKQQFRDLCKFLQDIELPCEAANNFVPESIKLTGPSTKQSIIRDYITRSMERAAALGVQRLVFGSSGARNVPEGFSRSKAWDQLKSFLRIASEEAKQYGIMIVIEPINHGESNIVNSTHEGTMLMQEISLLNVQMLVDYFHYTIEKDCEADICELRGSLHHAHFSQPKGRVFPVMSEIMEYYPFFNYLKRISYDERMSMEGFSAFPRRDAQEALKVLRSLASNNNL